MGGERELRGTGRTTRLCDSYIQKLFNEGTTGPIRDHHNDFDSNNYLRQKIITRLENEFCRIPFTQVLNEKERVVTIKLNDFLPRVRRIAVGQPIIDLDIVAWRDDIEKIIFSLRQYETSRHLALAITHLEDAQMRLGCLFSEDKNDGIIKR